MQGAKNRQVAGKHAHHCLTTGSQKGHCQQDANMCGTGTYGRGKHQLCTSSSNKTTCTSLALPEGRNTIP
eukprot:1161902-Pelagomonas_calceolata.AAC.14